MFIFTQIVQGCSKYPHKNITELLKLLLLLLLQTTPICWWIRLLFVWWRHVLLRHHSWHLFSRVTQPSNAHQHGAAIWKILAKNNTHEISFDIILIAFFWLKAHSRSNFIVSVVHLVKVGATITHRRHRGPRGSAACRVLVQIKIKVLYLYF